MYHVNSVTTGSQLGQGRSIHFQDLGDAPEAAGDLAIHLSGGCGHERGRQLGQQRLEAQALGQDLLGAALAGLPGGTGATPGVVAREDGPDWPAPGTRAA
jgi:hypothetical protein